LDARASTVVGEWVIARLILVNGPPASGKSTLARRFVDHHDRSALVEFDAMRMGLPNWEGDEATRLVARNLAGAATAEHLTAGRDVVMPQYFGRLGFIVVLEGIAREHEANFVEVILSIDTSLAIDRFLARRRAMAERGERHPEREIPDADVEAFIVDAVDRLTRLPAARPGSRIVPVEFGASEDDVYRRLLTVLDEGAEAPCRSR
jgi:predicted kinase